MKPSLSSLKNPFLFILEAGVNHEGNLDLAMKLIEDAAKSGADYIKFQTYTAARLAASNSPSYWNLEEESTNSQIELFSKYDGFVKEDYFKLAERAKAVGIGFMTTCFDEIWVDELDEIISIYKIASADITNFPLIEHIAKKNKPILLSTGASTLSEVHQAVEVIREHNLEDLCVMHCVLNYPTEFENAQLNRISTLIKNFPNLYIGYSDHTRPEFSKLSLQTAFALGARVFEKHFTFDKTLVGNDHYHSFNHEDGSQMVETLKKVSQMLKFDEDTFIKSQESARKNARRGMYASVNLPAGHRIGYTDVIALRPVFIEGGVEPQNMKLLIGKKVIETIEAGKPLLLNNLTD